MKEIPVILDSLVSNIVLALLMAVGLLALVLFLFILRRLVVSHAQETDTFFTGGNDGP